MRKHWHLDPSMFRHDNGLIVVAASLATALAFLCFALASRSSRALEQLPAAAATPQVLLTARYSGSDASVPNASSVRLAVPDASARVAETL